MDREKVVEIMAAVGTGNLARTEALLKDDPGLVNARSGGNGVLHAAAVRGHAEVALMLLAHGAEANAQDEKGWTPLHTAAAQGAADVAKVLLAHGAEANSRDGLTSSTPLHMASQQGHAEVARLLLANGADANARTELGGFTPLRLAEGKPEMAELLRRHGGRQ